jgi:hypothetical protein
MFIEIQTMSVATQKLEPTILNTDHILHVVYSTEGEQPEAIIFMQNGSLHTSGPSVQKLRELTYN